LRIFLIIVAALALNACSPQGLAPGLTARMDAPGASLDRAEALNIINQFRATTGAQPLRLDANLNAQAQALAAQYAGSGTAPKKPDNVNAMRVSAGYPSFAETFSGWRSTKTDAAAMSDPANTRAGLGVAYVGNSTYGTHWIILFQSDN
jgi:uncharacterized protein YkwD